MNRNKKRLRRKRRLLKLRRRSERLFRRRRKEVIQRLLSGGTKHYYPDENGEPVLVTEDNFDEYSTAWQGPNLARSVVANTVVEGVRVSTVMLPFDHNLGRFYGPDPVLWETMVFGGALDGSSQRYSTRQAAIEGHGEFVARVLSVADASKRIAMSKEDPDDVLLL